MTTILEFLLNWAIYIVLFFIVVFLGVGLFKFMTSEWNTSDGSDDRW